jgi:thiamine kinase-like enzyme
MKNNIEELENKAKKLLSTDNIQIERMKGGLSRELYKLTLDNNKSYLLRILKDSNYANYEREQFFFKKLSDLNFGPKFITGENEVRIEEYFNCSENIKANEIVNYHRQLAYTFGTLHSLQLINNEEPSFIENKLTNEWMVTTFHEKCKEVYKDEKDKKFIFDLNKTEFIKTEIEFVLNLIKDEDKALSHNDVWVGNILVLKNEKQVKLIDYEIMGMNFRSYDLGKLILESIFERKINGIFYDLVENNFPTKEQIVNFILDYLFAYHNQGKPDELTFEEVKLKLLNVFNDDKKLLEEVNRIYKGIFKGIISACLYLIIIGVALGRDFSKDLDLFEFAMDHYYLYLKYKKFYEALDEINYI